MTKYYSIPAILNQIIEIEILDKLYYNDCIHKRQIREFIQNMMIFDSIENMLDRISKHLYKFIFYKTYIQKIVIFSIDLKTLIRFLNQLTRIKIGLINICDYRNSFPNNIKITITIIDSVLNYNIYLIKKYYNNIPHIISTISYDNKELIYTHKANYNMLPIQFKKIYEWLNLIIQLYEKYDVENKNTHSTNYISYNCKI